MDFRKNLDPVWNLVLKRVSKFVIPQFRDTLLVPKITKCEDLLYSFFDFRAKFMFSKNATKIDKIFTVNLTVTTYCQTDGEDLVNFFAFSENVNFNDCYKIDQWRTIPKDE